MRLQQKEIDIIKKYFKIFFKEGEIYLFGSRVYDDKKGGDIDLYISVKNRVDLVKKKIKFLSRVKRKLGEQKIDIVFASKEERAIDRIAKKEGILL